MTIITDSSKHFKHILVFNKGRPNGFPYEFVSAPASPCH